MNFVEIESKVIKWAEERDIFKESSSLAQYDKLGEEYSELLNALYESDLEKIKDAIGDMMVVLTSIAHFYNLDLTQCYASAYNEIKDRKGKMINGLFVKEE